MVLDAGALIAIERGAVPVRGYVLLADRGHVALTTSAAVVAQVWRGGNRQARLARLAIPRTSLVGVYRRRISSPADRSVRAA
jgi:hypothetical protein